MNRRRGLGRGLDALLSPKDATNSRVKEVDKPAEITLDALQPGRFQSRKEIDDLAIEELTASVRAQGVLQPIIVRLLPNQGKTAERYEIVAGERRWRAAMAAGLSSIPAIARELDDQSALAIAIIENLQREDLNPMEESSALMRLAEEFALTHQQVAEAVGRSRSAVTNLLRLQDLHIEVKAALATSKIDMGHARALLSLDVDDQPRLATEIVDNALTVRQVERAVRQHQSDAHGASSPSVPIDLQTRWLQKSLSEEVGKKVEIRPLKNGKHKLAVEFQDVNQLTDLLAHVQQLLQVLNDTAGPRARDADSQ